MTAGSEAFRRPVEVINARGLHARVAARIAATAERFDAEVRVGCKGHDVSALSIMGLLMLAASTGARLDLVATGAEAQAAVEALAALFAAGCEEA